MILAYHRINPWCENDPLTVKPENFKKQLEYLISKNFHSVSFDELIANNKKKLFIVTFDDGFADNLWFAYKVLLDFNVKPLIFLIVDYIGSDKIFSRYKDKEKDRFLNWKEVIEMSENVEFGSHTLTHPHLIKISEKEAEKEIIISKKKIEDRIGKEVKFFCYPYGEFNESIIEIVKKAGYKAAFVTPKKGYKIKNSIYTLKRIGIYGHNNFLTFKIKIWKEYLIEKFYFFC